MCYWKLLDNRRPGGLDPAVVILLPGDQKRAATTGSSAA